MMNEIYTEIEKAKSFGYREASNGAKLYGHTPHIAPEAWLHILYKPLIEEEINKLEEETKVRIPSIYRTFLRWSNGLNLFSGSLSFYGLRVLNYREGDKAIQPFNIVTPNTLERPKDAKSTYLFIGGYNWDGSKLYLDNETLKVYRCDRYSAEDIKNEWRNFEETLKSEVSRLSALFDEKGKEIDEDIPTTP